MGARQKSDPGRGRYLGFRRRIRLASTLFVHGSQSAPGWLARMPAMGPALAFVQENAAHENAID